METSPSMGEWMGGIMSNHLNVKSFHLIKINDFDLRLVENPPTFGWMYGLVGRCQITKNGIYLDLFKIIKVYLKIYDLWRLPHLWLDVWVGGWMGRIMSNH